MKVGIVTFHCALNYGALAQTYALQEFLKNNNYEVEIINYQPDYLTDPYRLFNYNRWASKSFKGKIKYLLLEPFLFIKRYKRHRKLISFVNKKLAVSPQIFRKHSEINTKCDAFIFGSDQIWNPEITKGFDPIYFGDITPLKDSKKISYAASVEPSKLTESARKELVEHVASFKAISVRENSLADFLQAFTSKKIHTVLDPTLLVPVDVWKKIAVKPKVKEKYVLLYQARGGHQIPTKIAQQIANDINGKVVNVSGMEYPILKNSYQNTSVEEFIGYCMHADFIVTLSFHGTAFSVIFNKPFYSLDYNDNRNNRIKDLLQNLGLEDRLVNVNSNISYSEIDYTETNKKLDALKSSSASFLAQSL